MKKTRTLASVAGALALVTGAASVALLANGGAATAAGVPSSAYALNLSLADNAVLDHLAAVESTDGKPTTNSVVELPLDALLDADVITASAENGKASAQVAGLSVASLTGPLAELATLAESLQPVCDGLDALSQPLNQVLDLLRDPATGTILPDVLEGLIDPLNAAGVNLTALAGLDLSEVLPESLASICDFVASGNLVGADVVKAECNGDTGTTTIEGLNGLVGSLIDTNTANSKIAIEGLLEVTVNEQTANADGTFTVNALHVNLLDGVLDLTVASATCGEVTSDTVDPSDAPTPTPVESHVPVTG